MSENVCAMCGKTFESRSKLTQHSIQTHEEKKCDECGNMFKKANFARHLKVHTGRSSVLTCEECGKTFNRTDVFRKHVNRFHGETAEHECGDCKKTTSSFNPVVSIKTMFHFVATMSFQEFHFPFHNDRRSWRQHFLSMNRGGKAD